MKRVKKGWLFIGILLALWILPLVIAPTVIEVPTQPVKQASVWDFFKSSFFKWFIIIFIIIVIFLVLIFFIVRWLVKYFKMKSDIFYVLKNQRLKLARNHRSYPSGAWLRYGRNTPIRLAYKDEKGYLRLTRPIAYHKGDYMTQEGNLCISFNMDGNKILWVFPRTELLVIPNRKEMEIKVKDVTTGETKIEKITGLPTVKEMVQFNENEILIFAKAISNLGYFYIPVLETKDGEIIDLSVPTYISVKNVVLGEYLFEQSTDFASVMKKALEINPFIKGAVKLSDSNSQVDVPQGQK